MNLLKYTRNSTSRQYLHERGGRIYIHAGCIAPFKPPSVSTMAAGPCGRSFYCCRAAQSGSRGKKVMHRSSRTREIFLRRLEVGLGRPCRIGASKRTNRKNKVGDYHYIAGNTSIEYVIAYFDPYWINCYTLISKN